MPDFYTRRPQVEGQDGAATRGRVASIANKVRTMLAEDLFRTSLISVGVPFGVPGDISMVSPSTTLVTLEHPPPP